MINDPIADMLTRIKNGYMARKQDVAIPYSKVKENILKVLEKKGYITNIQKTQDNQKLTLKVDLVYQKKQPVMTDVVRISKPGVRIYTKKNAIPTILGGLGTVIISTPQGMMFGEEAKKKGLGGELICKIW